MLKERELYNQQVTFNVVSQYKQTQFVLLISVKISRFRLNKRLNRGYAILISKRGKENNSMGRLCKQDRLSV